MDKALGVFADSLQLTVATKEKRGGPRSIFTLRTLASCVALTQILIDKRKESFVAFFSSALWFYEALGVTVPRVINGMSVSLMFREACATLGLKHIRTRPYTSCTNGKAERFIQMALREWAYAASYPNSDERASELPRWLHEYNFY